MKLKILYFEYSLLCIEDLYIMKKYLNIFVYQFKVDRSI